MSSCRQFFCICVSYRYLYLISALRLSNCSSYLLDGRHSTRFNSVPCVMYVGWYHILSITVQPVITVEQYFIAFVEDVDFLPTHCV